MPCSAVQKYWGVTTQDRFKHRSNQGRVFYVRHEAKIFQTWQKWKTMKLDLPWSTYLPKYPYLQEDGTMIACWKLLHRVCHWKDKEDKSYIPNPPNASLQQHPQVSHWNCLLPVMTISQNRPPIFGTGWYWDKSDVPLISCETSCLLIPGIKWAPAPLSIHDHPHTQLMRRSVLCYVWAQILMLLMRQSQLITVVFWTIVCTYYMLHL